jgi:hypothetical protein
MPFGQLHDFFERQCPDGTGIGLRISLIERLGRAVIDTLGRPLLNVNSDVPLPQHPQVRFSFTLDPGSFRLRPGGLLSLNLTVWLHPAGHPDLPIVTLTFSIADATVQVGTDPVDGDLRWVPRGSTLPTVSAPAWGPDKNLIAAGYVTNTGAADRNKFNEDIYYGFVWITSANLVSGIVANLPIPQVHRWVIPFSLKPPIESSFSTDYLAIWSNLVGVNPIFCGPTNPPLSTRIVTNWNVGPMPPGPLSPDENASPELLIYVAAQQLLDRKAGTLMPAVMLDATNGGGYIRWNLRASAGLAALTLTLQPSNNGGSLIVDGRLNLIGDASAWIDGPSGIRAASIDESLKANADVHGSITARFDVATFLVDLDTSIGVTVDQRTVQLGGGGLLSWPIQPVVNAIVEFLINRGAIELPSVYNRLHQEG